MEGWREASDGLTAYCMHSQGRRQCPLSPTFLFHIYPPRGKQATSNPPLAPSSPNPGSRGSWRESVYADELDGVQRSQAERGAASHSCGLGEAMWNLRLCCNQGPAGTSYLNPQPNQPPTRYVVTLLVQSIHPPLLYTPYPSTSLSLPNYRKLDSSLDQRPLQSLRNFSPPSRNHPQ